MEELLQYLALVERHPWNDLLLLSDRFLNRSELEKWSRPALAEGHRLSGMLKVGDVLDLSEMIGPAFQDMARRDFTEAQNLAVSFTHRGLGLMAQLSTARVLLEEAGLFKAPVKAEEKEVRK